VGAGLRDCEASVQANCRTIGLPDYRTQRGRLLGSRGTESVALVLVDGLPNLGLPDPRRSVSRKSRTHRLPDRATSRLSVFYLSRPAELRELGLGGDRTSDSVSLVPQTVLSPTRRTTEPRDFGCPKVKESRSCEVQSRWPDGTVELTDGTSGARRAARGAPT